MQGIHDQSRTSSPKRVPRIGIQCGCVILYLIQRSEVLQRLPGDFALMVRMQIEELASGMRSTTDFGYALPESCLVTAKMLRATFQRLCCGPRYVAAV